MIVAAVQVQPPLRIPLSISSGHVLAADVVAAIPLPPWTNAAMDGYAVRGADVAGATAATPRTLTVVDEVAAGAAVSREIGAGEAVRIFTGAPVPRGADTVVRQEDTRRTGNRLIVHDDRDNGANVRVSGGDVARGSVALTTGTLITPPRIALLAALGVSHPVVYRKPRVGILTTGNEIIGIDHPEAILAGTRLGDTNAPALAALVTQAGGVAVPLGIVRDDPEALARAVAAAADIDLLITAGGVSVGDHDHVRAVMAATGVRMIVTRVQVRPGGPTAFGTLPDGRSWLALPGNPVSAMVTFELFGRTVIRAMAGHGNPRRRRFAATIATAVRRDRVLDQYLRCTFTWPADGALPTATITGAQGSGMLMSIARADGLAVIEAGDAVVAAGSVVQALEFGP